MLTKLQLNPPAAPSLRSNHAFGTRTINQLVMIVFFQASKSTNRSTTCGKQLPLGGGFAVPRAAERAVPAPQAHRGRRYSHEDGQETLVGVS